MLLALEREKNPGGDAPPVTLRGFSWIVSPYESGGVIVHLEMQMGTASAGPFADRGSAPHGHDQARHGHAVGRRAHSLATKLAR